MNTLKLGVWLTKWVIIVVLLFVFDLSVVAQSSNSIYQKDFEQYWNIVNESFGYFDTQKTDWKKVKEIYKPQVAEIENRDDFIRLLEKCNLELYNGHISLNTNLPSSSKLIPSQTDLWVRKINGKYLIQGIREGFNSDLVGLKIGMEIIKYNDQPIEEALIEFLPKSFTDYDSTVYEFAVNTLLAGTHNSSRKITVREEDIEKDFFPDQLDNKFNNSAKQLLDSKMLKDNVGYIRINNSLWNKNLIAEFDQAMEELKDTEGLILDLRETPSGGNNTVGKAILGRFTKKEFPYQRYRYVYDEKDTDVEQVWTELVLPRGQVYEGPVVVLVGYWTGSMGEGMTIGFDQLGRMNKMVITIGSPMADLLGAVWGYTLDETKIGFQIPGVKLYHVDGTPREQFEPTSKRLGNKECLDHAIWFLTEF